MKRTDATVPVVFLPCDRPLAPGESDVDLRTYETAEGSALPVFSSLDALVEGCGDHQPWLGIPVDLLGELQRRCGADEVLWDAILPGSDA